jgi:integrase
MLVPIELEAHPEYTFPTTTRDFTAPYVKEFKRHIAYHPMWDAYLQHIETNCTKSSQACMPAKVQEYRAYLIEHYAPERDGPMDIFRFRDLATGFISTFDDSHPSTYRWHRNFVNTIIRFFWKNGYMIAPIAVSRVQQINDLHMLMMEKSMMKRRDATMTKDEVIKLVSWLNTHGYEREYVLVVMMFNLCLRISEALAVRRKDFYMYEGIPYLNIIGKSKKDKKGPKPVQIDPPEIYNIIMAYMDYYELTDPEDYVITRINKGGEVTKTPIARESALRIIKRITNDALGREMTTHTMKRSRVTTLMNEHVPAEQISKLARTNPITLMNYYDMNKGKHDLGRHSIL